MKYEVKPQSPNPNTHLGDYELAILNYPQRYFQSMFDYARNYWAMTPAANHEVLIDCPVEILALVDRPV